MKSLRSTALLFAFTLSLVASAYGACDNDWFPFKNYCYKDYSNSKIYDDAQAYCETKGAHLATIPTTAANEFINSLDLTPYVNYWIGLKSDGDWNVRPFHWNDGTVVDQTQTHWSEHEPNNGGGSEHCAEYTHRSGMWNGINCSQRRFFLCSKFDEEFALEATTLAELQELIPYLKSIFASMYYRLEELNE